jgi:hypothetical protein
MAYSIPQTLWESLEAILFTKGQALAKEVALELGVPVKPLLASLNSKEKSKFTILPDDDTSTYQCQALQLNGATYMRCRCPSLKPSPSFCQLHERYAMDVPRGLTKVRRIEGLEVPYLLNGNTVYTLGGEKCGILKGSTITLFEVIP